MENKKVIILDLASNKISVVTIKMEKGADLTEAVEEILPSNNCVWMEVNDSTKLENIQIDQQGL